MTKLFTLLKVDNDFLGGDHYRITNFFFCKGVTAAVIFESVAEKEGEVNKRSDTQVTDALMPN